MTNKAAASTLPMRRNKRKFPRNSLKMRSRIWPMVSGTGPKLAGLPWLMPGRVEARNEGHKQDERDQQRERNTPPEQPSQKVQHEDAPASAFSERDRALQGRTGADIFHHRRRECKAQQEKHPECVNRHG